MAYLVALTATTDPAKPQVAKATAAPTAAEPQAGQSTSEELVQPPS